MTDLLNSPQREAIHYLDGPCLVLAGAGSGKTRVITQKITYLIEQCGYSAKNIAAITFTNKAAREMHGRVGALLDKKAVAGLTVCTFHALGLRLLRSDGRALGLTARFSILDISDVLQILADLLGDQDKALAKSVLWQISAWKNALLRSPAEVSALAQDDISRRAAAVFPLYEKALRAYQAVDFDDLIYLPVRLFTEHPEVLERWQSRLRYLLIDEYQDTNKAQYYLIQQLTGVRGALTAVGDDDQAIYAWRGADAENLHALQKDWPNLKLIKLEQNYRSTRRILHAANTLISCNDKLFQKRLWSDHGDGEVIRISAMRDAEHEAEAVAMKIDAHRFASRGHYRDYAILYRSNHQARIIEQRLRSQNIPYVLSGGQSFFERAEIRDLIAYLRLLANHKDDLAFIRSATTPRRGIGPKTIEQLGAYAASRHLSMFQAAHEMGWEETLPAHQRAALQLFVEFIDSLSADLEQQSAGAMLERLMKGIEYENWLFSTYSPREAEQKWRNVGDFTDWLARKGERDEKNLLELTQMISLMSLLDTDDGAPDAVQLATLHAAKGLEFAHVYMIGMEEGLLPHQNTIDEDKVEEERRLAYVGITRARRTLNISWCERRKTGKEWRHCDPSRFIEEMGKDGVDNASDKKQQPVTAEEGRQRLAELQKLLSGGAAPNKPEL